VSTKPTSVSGTNGSAHFTQCYSVTSCLQAFRMIAWDLDTGCSVQRAYRNGSAPWRSSSPNSCVCVCVCACVRVCVCVGYLLRTLAAPVRRLKHPPCSLLDITGKRKFQNSKSYNFVTVAKRTHVDVTFLKVRKLILKLWNEVIGHLYSYHRVVRGPNTKALHCLWILH
jgi:hypothetical protein